MNLREILADIHALEKELLEFERKFGIRIEDYELYNRLPAVIDWYGYEVWRGAEKKLYWYASQPHPNDPTLQSTHPHHKRNHLENNASVFYFSAHRQCGVIARCNSPKEKKLVDEKC